MFAHVGIDERLLMNWWIDERCLHMHTCLLYAGHILEMEGTCQYSQKDTSFFYWFFRVKVANIVCAVVLEYAIILWNSC